MNKNCLLCGVGGQGVVLASKLIAAAAMKKGYDVKTTDTIGMAQRGGSVVSHARIGNDIKSPIIPYGEADVIIAFEPAEAVRSLPSLSQDGVMIVNENAVIPVTAALSGGNYNGAEMVEYLKSAVKNIYFADGAALCRECGSEKVLNVALLGALAKTDALDIDPDDMRTAVLSLVPEKYRELNMRALEIGASIIKN